MWQNVRFKTDYQRGCAWLKTLVTAHFPRGKETAKTRCSHKANLAARDTCSRPSRCIVLVLVVLGVCLFLPIFVSFCVFWYFVHSPVKYFLFFSYSSLREPILFGHDDLQSAAVSVKLTVGDWQKRKKTSGRTKGPEMAKKKKLSQKKKRGRRPVDTHKEMTISTGGGLLYIDERPTKNGRKQAESIRGHSNPLGDLPWPRFPGPLALPHPA